jgi:hypothetical protein
MDPWPWSVFKNLDQTRTFPEENFLLKKTKRRLWWKALCWHNGDKPQVTPDLKRLLLLFPLKPDRTGVISGIDVKVRNLNIKECFNSDQQFHGQASPQAR